jgi:type IX secretion system PorP/SprF family membrane protein
MSMKKITLIAIAFIAMLGESKAQQDPVFSQYMFNMSAINPAYVGSRDVFSFTATYRKQWVDLAGAPTTGLVSIDFPVAKKSIGIGVSAFTDKVGIFNNTGGYAQFAYRLRLGNGILALGLQAGAFQYTADWTKVSTTDPDNAFSTNFNKVLPNFGFGAYYNTDRWYVGASAPRLLTNKINDSSTGSLLTRHFYLTGGVVIGLSPSVKLKPSVLLRAVQGGPMSFDLNLNAWFVDRIGVGVSYRYGSGVIGMVEIQASQRFRIGYAYDMALTKIRSYSSGTHEAMLRYEFGFDKKKVISPRYF